MAQLSDDETVAKMGNAVLVVLRGWSFAWVGGKAEYRDLSTSLRSGRDDVVVVLRFGREEVSWGRASVERRELLWRRFGRDDVS
jgi:hypothetical protein